MGMKLRDLKTEMQADNTRESFPLNVLDLAIRMYKEFSNILWCDKQSQIKL